MINYTIRIERDDIPYSPREWDNLGTITAKHSRYTLGDEQPNCIQEWLECETGLEHDQLETLWDKNPSQSEYMDALLDIFKRENIVLPVYMYEHGNIALSTGGFSCPWDSGQVGFIHVSKDKVRKEYGVKRISQKTLDKVHRVLKDEIETYSQYVNGDVYAFLIEDKDGNIIDSCGGFYGLEYCESEARSMVDYLENDNRVKRVARLKTLIKNRVPLENRINILDKDAG